MPKRTTKLDDWLTEHLQDPRAAAGYINTAIDEAPDLLPVVLGHVAKALRMSKVAKKADIPRESLYAMLDEDSNPTLENISAIVGAMGLKILVAPADASAPDGAIEKEPQQVVFRQQPLNTNEVLGQTAITGVALKPESAMGVAQSNSGFAFNQLGEAQSGIVQHELAEERGQALQWNQMNLPQAERQNFQNGRESLMMSSTKPTPTMCSWNQLLGT